MATKILYLAAGDSQRFADVGFRMPKCNLPINSAPAGSNLPDIKAMLNVNVTGCASASDILVRKFDVCTPSGVTDVVVTKTQRGAGGSAVMASAHIAPTDSVILMDTDNYYTDYSFIAKIKDFLKNTASSFGSVITIVPETWMQPNMAGVMAMQNSVFRNRLTNKTMLQAINEPLFNRYSRPIAPEVGELSGDATHARAVNVGVYFVQKWAQFVAAYNTELSNRDNDELGSDATSEISIVDVLRTLENQSVPNMTHISIPFDIWRPCGTVDQYLMNKGW